ncbi:uncharacterized protein BDR25DRAFT_365896 [Lindgomyces ingoldianus]|uniref:Uncharacterized protein n=1 Tax=Lindgomyces ingoldianus TaxID=673940 RepID=A0ACB6R2L2_9PLEO|nr:uncharacterized protein BDR25DRAFT_365896 [Lindgomyces ingoldianus]KAF2472752.1 hypothetical protein BDR25DRAFT_365896 [Lindgomyces ingoldianus]
MLYPKPLLLALFSATSALCATLNPDFSGTGNIFVVKGSELTTSPAAKVGCLTASGRFVSDYSKCGIFAHDPANYTSMESPVGHCSFGDPSAESGRPQAPPLYAFKCGNPSASTLFYSPNFGEGAGSPPWIWVGNLNWHFEATKIPTAGEDTSLFISNFINLPADRFALMLLWAKLS